MLFHGPRPILVVVDPMSGPCGAALGRRQGPKDQGQKSVEKAKGNYGLKLLYLHVYTHYRVSLSDSRVVMSTLSPAPMEQSCHISTNSEFLASLIWKLSYAFFNLSLWSLHESWRVVCYIRKLGWGSKYYCHKRAKTSKLPFCSRQGQKVLHSLLHFA